MRIVVTGAAGMIGSNLCAKLVQQGHVVVGIDNLWRGKEKNLCYFGLDKHEKFELHIADLTHMDDWRHLFKGADCVYHLADIVAGIGFVFANEGWIFRKNLKINMNVLEVCRDFSVGRYIYVGTACSFPKALQNSTDSVLIESQKFPADPESAYGWSKLMGEVEASYFREETNIPTVLLTLHNVYGAPCAYEGPTSQVVPALLNRAMHLGSEEPLSVWGDGTQGRAFVHVNDVVQALLSSMTAGHETTHAIQIGPSKCTTISDVAHDIKEVLGRDFEIEFDLSKPTGDKGRSANYSLAKKVLNWEPTVDFKQGLRDLVEFIKHDQKAT